jgi:tetratricopeptide (TPR) repeat protein
MGLFKKNKSDSTTVKQKLWSRDDEKYFFERYSQSGYNKPEYLVDQAYSLYWQNASEDIDVYDAIIRMLETYISDFPDDKTVKAAALYLVGLVYRDRGNTDKMFEFLKKAADTEQEFPDKIVGAGLYYSEQIVKHGKDELLDDVEKYVGHYFNDKFQSPLLIYHVSAILTAVAEKNRDREKQRYYKDRAEAALKDIANVDKELRHVTIIKVKNLNETVKEKISLFMIENGFEVAEYNDALLWQKKGFACLHNIAVETVFDIIVIVAFVILFSGKAFYEAGLDGLTGSAGKRPLRKIVDNFERTFKDY